MRALSIRQPFAELILRGIKTIEYRTRPTRIIGERFYIYASKKLFSYQPSANDQ
jgi:predicted transcriptional regulator